MRMSGGAIKDRGIRRFRFKNPMKPISILCVSSVVAIFACSSCGENPGLVAKRDAQKAEIDRLSEELANKQEKLKNLPPDVSVDLARAKKQVVQKNAEIEQLEGELAGLTERKRALQTEFDAYRAKYQIK